MRRRRTGPIPIGFMGLLNYSRDAIAGAVDYKSRLLSNGLWRWHVL